MTEVLIRPAYHTEWLLTNGLGGYALGYGNHLNERKYNGLLIAGLPGFKRVHVLSSLEETVEWRGIRFNLDANHYPDTIHPHGYRHIIKSWLRPYPSTLYSTDPGTPDFLILKELFMPRRVNAVVVKYTNLGAFPVNLLWRPKLTLRDHHEVNQPGFWDQHELEIELGEDRFSVFKPGLEQEVWGYSETGGVAQQRTVFRNVFYPMEASRGYPSSEDLLSPVDIAARLIPGQSERLVFSLGAVDEPFELADKAEQAARKAPLPADHPALIADRPQWLDRIRQDQPVFTPAETRRILDLAAEDFLTDDDCLAGYPWFGPWGRDSMIALGGVALLKNGRRRAMRILKKYGRAIQDGLLPNTFGEGGGGLNYHSVDGPLWFALRAGQVGPTDKQLFSKVRDVVLNYAFNTNLPFFKAEDGLIELRPGPWALTWMDAKIYDNPVTPRTGKPVEINALWYNALLVLIEMALAQGLKPSDKLRSKPYSASLAELADLGERVADSLSAFVGPDFLADRIEDGQPVFEVRPNAVIAAGLPRTAWSADTLRAVLATAERELLTTHGLRSLSPHHPAFKKKYLGSHKQRDLAYHQGTVWAWPLACYARLYLKVNGENRPRSEKAEDLTRLIWHFRDGFMRGRIASVAEIWDGLDPALPKGCPAQAWSVMAVLEIESLISELAAER